MIRRRFLTLGLLILSSLFFAACNESAQQSDKAQDALPQISVGGVTLNMELALSREQQRTGLMFRDGIASDHGMLFVFDDPQPMSFWMKNVSFPIDIGYFTADGVLREVYPMYPHDTQSRKSIRDDLLYVLEVESGWFKKNGVKTGAQLDLKAVNNAVASRSKR